MSDKFCCFGIFVFNRFLFFRFSFHHFFILVLVFVNEFVIFSFFTIFVFVNENHTGLQSIACSFKEVFYNFCRAAIWLKILITINRVIKIFNQD